ncbi:hypothetical protein BJ912DRAFT_931760 [Pholiota molesta]|nr:hypothetical protein BJ912DRAFT_931760 [Pholiota molesta]
MKPVAIHCSVWEQQSPPAVLRVGHEPPSASDWPKIGLGFHSLRSFYAGSNVNKDDGEDVEAIVGHDDDAAMSVNILHEIVVVRQERSSIQLGNSARTATPPS